MLFAKLRKTPLTIVHDVMMPCLLIVVVMISLHPIQLLAAAQPNQTAQPDTLVVTRAMLGKSLSFDITDKLLLRFHAGDDMRWKEPNFDDSQWQFVRNDTAGRMLPEGIGWYRMYIRFMPETVPTTASLATGYLFFSAQELYINGRLVDKHGQPSSSWESQKYAAYHTLFPTTTRISFEQGKTYLFAFRVSTFGRPSVRPWFQWIRFMPKHFDRGARLYLSLRGEMMNAKDQDINQWC